MPGRQCISEDADLSLADHQLLKQCAAGNEAAFEELYDRYQPAVYRFALYMGGGAAMAEEVTQEVFLALIRRPADFDPERGSLAAYLCGMARNFLRRASRENRDVEQMPDEPAWSSNEDVVGDLTSRERLAALNQAILALPVHYREVVILCNLQGMDYSEAAAALGCAEGTVCSRLNRARALLIAKLKGCGTCLKTSSG
jgi:RNA polymerase sigma-70 factor (ECF subfamily)